MTDEAGAALRAAPADSRRWWSLAALSLAAAAVWLAASDLSVALPTIAKDLGGSMTTLQWAVTGFSLATGAFVATGGRLADVFGRRSFLELGLIIFSAASVVCAMAPHTGVLIVGRVLMGVGAALILPATLAIIPVEFSGREQVTAFSVWMGVAGAGQALGPMVGGGLTQALGWTWIFWVSIPICVAALLVLRATTAESRDPNARHSIDVFGLATLSLGLVALLYALNEGPEKGWGSAVILGSTVLGVALLVTCLVIERHIHNPLIDLKLFRRHSFDGALVDNFVYNITLGGTMYVLALYFENVRGYNPFDAGLLLLPSTIAMLALLPVGARVGMRRGPRWPLAVGTAIMGLGTLTLGFVGSQTIYVWIALGLVVQAVGIGLFSTPLSDTAVGLAPLDEAGAASGLFKTASMVGGAFGVAVFAAVGRALGGSHFTSDVAGMGLTQAQTKTVQNAFAGSQQSQSALSSLPATVQDEVMAAWRSAYAFGVGNSLKVAAVFAAVAVLAVLWLVPKGVLSRGGEASDPGTIPESPTAVAAGRSAAAEG